MCIHDFLRRRARPLLAVAHGDARKTTSSRTCVVGDVGTFGFFNSVLLNKFLLSCSVLARPVFEGGTALLNLTNSMPPRYNM